MLVDVFVVAAGGQWHRGSSSPGADLDPQHGWRVWILGLNPAFAAAGPVRHVEPLCDDAFETELAGVVEHEPAVVFNMLIEQDAVFDAPECLGEPSLACL